MFTLSIPNRARCQIDHSRNNAIVPSNFCFQALRYHKISNISPGLIDIFNQILGGLYSGGLIFGRKFVLVSRGAYIQDFTVFSRNTLLMTALSLLFNFDLQINIVVSQYLHNTLKDRVRR